MDWRWSDASDTDDDEIIVWSDVSLGGDSPQRCASPFLQYNGCSRCGTTMAVAHGGVKPCTCRSVHLRGDCIPKCWLCDICQQVFDTINVDGVIPEQGWYHTWRDISTLGIPSPD